MIVEFSNQCFDTLSSFAVEWDGGETARTEIIGNTTATIDLSTYNIPDGKSCWARAYVQLGPNHDSGSNFTYHPNGNSVTYTLTGTVDSTSFSCDGCDGAPLEKGQDSTVAMSMESSPEE
jgi:hypothetical protein